MAFLAVIGSKSTNGVAYIHSEIIKETIFKVSNSQTELGSAVSRPAKTCLCLLLDF